MLINCKCASLVVLVCHILYSYCKLITTITRFPIGYIYLSDLLVNKFIISLFETRHYGCSRVYSNRVVIVYTRYTYIYDNKIYNSYKNIRKLLNLDYSIVHSQIFVTVIVLFYLNYSLKIKMLN